MAFEDRILTCKECGRQFTFSASEQEFYAQKGFRNDPARCPECRAARKRARNSPKEMFTVICAECGVETQVSFKPRNDRPVYCNECYEKRKYNNNN